jgi:hypothetical protein
MSEDNAQTVPINRAPVISAEIEDNVLDKFDLPTYHFRLYMMADDAVRKGIFGPKSKDKRVVIAESGVTTLEIDEVEVHSVGGITRAAGVGTTTEFSFTLKEPFGATLLDQISNSAKALGIKNFSKIPFYLELSFKGRKSGEDQTQEPGSIGELTDLVWTWPLIFTKMAMDVSSGGTVYSINAAIYGDLAYTNQASDAQKQMTISVVTVADFFTGLQTQMNQRENEKLETANYKVVDKYTFYVDEEIAKALVVPELLEERKSRAGEFEEDGGKLLFTFLPGISIDRMVENVLSLTSFFTAEFPGAGENASDAPPADEPTFQKLYRVICDTIMGEYDETRQDYAREFRYLIIPYLQTTTLGPNTQNSTQSDEELYRAKAERGLIRKLYNYIYTGLNDQVLDFELVFNFNWYAALPLQAGRSTNPAAAEPKALLTPEQQEKLSETADKINQLRSFLANPAGFAPLSFLEDALAEFLSPVTDVTDQVQNEIDAAQAEIDDVIGAAIADADAALETVQAGIPPVPEVVPGIPSVPGLSNTINTALPGIGGLTSNPLLTGAGTLVDRLVSTTQFPRVNTPKIASPKSAQDSLREQDIYIDDPRISRGEELFKISTTETKSGDNAADIAQGTQASGRTMLSAMFEQAKSPIAGDLIDIDLNVKGDPFWLEPPPIHYNATPRSTLDRMLSDRGFISEGDSAEKESQEESSSKQPITPNFSSANASESQTYMVFRSFTPQEFDPKTGLTPAGKKSNNVLNGVYAVRKVTHSFAGGVFTQTLHGIRDPKINLKYVNLLAHLGVLSEVDNESNEYFANEAIESLNSADERIVGENGLNIRVDALTGEGQITEGGANISEEAFGSNPLAWPDPFGPTPPDEG